jgi:ubiquinone/menaquinone biosynthesis C-methylase UbiE
MSGGRSRGAVATMSEGGWDEIAGWRDARMGEEGDLWHRALIDPTLLSVIGPVRGRRVLDLGCGNGYLSRRFARAGAEVVAIDASPATLRFARRRERASPLGIRFEVRDASHLDAFADASFDLVVANMSLMDIRDAEGAVREVARVLHPNGRFVFSINHPCFDIDTQSMWSVEHELYEQMIWRKVRSYREEKEVDVPWRISESETRFTKSFHRTLATYSMYLREAGMAIVRLEEPSPLPELIEKSEQGRMIAEIPLHLVVEAVSRTTPRGSAPVIRPASRRSVRNRPKGGRRSGSPPRRRGSGSSRQGSRPGS